MSTPAARTGASRSTSVASVTSPSKKIAPSGLSGKAPQPSGTGLPAGVDQPYPAFTKVEDEDAPKDGRSYDFMMRSMNLYGHFFPLVKKSTSFTPITLNVSSIRSGINIVLTSALHRSISAQGSVQQNEIQATAEQLSNRLTTGCMLFLYTRLRYVNKAFSETSSTFIQKPHGLLNFEIPEPYALAFQQLGIFRVENLDHELELIPTISAADAATFCLGNSTWSPSQYQTAVEYAKKLGFGFKSPDLTVKSGSSWWLLKSTNVQVNYNLKCCLPESNYTNEDTVIRALWCTNERGGFHLDIADLSTLTMDRGTMLRNPPADIALTCFYGMMEQPAPLWNIN